MQPMKSTIKIIFLLQTVKLLERLAIVFQPKKLDPSKSCGDEDRFIGPFKDYVFEDLDLKLSSDLNALYGAVTSGQSRIIKWSNVSFSGFTLRVLCEVTPRCQPHLYKS